MTAESDGLPLSEAFEAFCDQEVVERWRLARRTPMPPALPIQSRYFSGRDEGFCGGDPGRTRAAQRRLVAHSRQQAWHALREDFRGRIASGEVVLIGLQVAPSLATARAKIPVIWSSLLRFRAPATVVVRDVQFIRVTAHRVRQLPAAAALAPSQEVAGEQATSAEESEANTPRRPRGRENVAPLIEADLRANWDDVQRRASRSSNGRPNWSELARAVRKRLVKSQGLNKPMPHWQTIRTRLPDIYARLLSENAVRK